MARREEKNTTQRRPEDWFPSVRAPGTASADDLSGKVDTTTEVIAGAGLTDGGDLSANVTLNVGAGTGITVNANDVAIDTTAEAERIRDTIGTALIAGSNVTITVSDPGDTITIDASSGTGYTDEQAQDAVGTILTDTATIDFTYNDASNQITADVKAESITLAMLDNSARVESFIIACSDETSSLTTGTAKVTFRIPYAFTITNIRANVNTAPTGSTLNVDVKKNGTSVFSTILTIDATEKTSVTAATPAVISTSSLSDDDEITIDITQVGSTIAGKGLKVTIIGHQ